MLVQIPHACERMVGGWTPSYPAIIRTLMVRIVRTIGLVFHPGLLDLVALTTKGTDIPSLDLGRCLNTILGPLVLMHSPEYRNTPDHSQGIQPRYLSHKPLCAQSKSFWWQAPSHAYHMGISHPYVPPCEPLSGGGS